MTTPEIIIWAVALAVGSLFAKSGNLTAGALCLAWLSAQVVYLITGNSLPVEFYLYPDTFVLITILLVKPERSIADWIVAAIFPIQWIFYVAGIHDFYRWWILYFLALAQFLAAGLDSFITYRREYRAVSDTPGTPSGRSEYAWMTRGYG